MPLYHRDIILCTDAGINGRRFRGGQVIAVDASNVTIKLHIELHMIDTRTVARAMAPAVIVGDPVACEVTGESPFLTVTAVHDAAFATPSGTNDITKGFFPGQIDAALHGQPKRLHWATGMLSERSSGYWRG